MAKLFSVASWNIEHFGRKSARVQRIAEFIAGQHGGPAAVPDIFALYEVEGKDVYREFMQRFPDHRFHLTEGKQTQEIFIGVHKGIQSFSTQRLEFKTGREYQRPGLLLSIRLDGIDYSLLFLHIKSGPDPEDFGLRDAALGHAFELKKALDKATGNQCRFIFLGDLNTMGINDPVPYSKAVDFDAAEEIARIADWADHRGMALLDKESTLIDGEQRQVSWYNGSRHYKPSNLDHVVATTNLNIRSAANAASEVSVLGWPQLNEPDWADWLENYSDHAMLYFEVWP